MNLKHVALASSSEKNSDRFFRELLGLECMQVKNLPASLSQQIFDQESDYKLIIYGDSSVQFEIFISTRKEFVDKPVTHICLEMDNRADFLTRCRAAKIEVRQVSKNDSTIVFIKDYDGNLFEIKEA
ncbi:MAG: VOC family protein [Proteobacteria bacterium]|nr:VOC family protein [Pseudomonadota bacterium]